MPPLPYKEPNMKAYQMKMVFSISVGVKEVNTILRQMGMDEALQMKDAVSVGVEQTLSFIPNEEYIQAVSDAIKQTYEQNGVEVTECRFTGYEYLRETEMQT